MFYSQNRETIHGNPIIPSLLTRKEAANYLGIAEQTLAIWKTTKRYNLPVVKVGRLVRYKQADLDAFITSRTLT